MCKYAHSPIIDVNPKADKGGWGRTEMNWNMDKHWSFISLAKVIIDLLLVNIHLPDTHSTNYFWQSSAPPVWCLYCISDDQIPLHAIYFWLCDLLAKTAANHACPYQSWGKLPSSVSLFQSVCLQHAIKSNYTEVRGTNSRIKCALCNILYSSLHGCN